MKVVGTPKTFTGLLKSIIQVVAAHSAVDVRIGGVIEIATNNSFMRAIGFMLYKELHLVFLLLEALADIFNKRFFFFIRVLKVVVIGRDMQ